MLAGERLLLGVGRCGPSARARVLDRAQPIVTIAADKAQLLVNSRGISRLTLPPRLLSSTFAPDQVRGGVASHERAEGMGLLLLPAAVVTLDAISILIALGGFSMTEQLLVRLPEALVRWFRRAVPARRRSGFIAALLEEALPPDDAGDDDPLYQAALAVEQDERLAGRDERVGSGDNRRRLGARAE